MSCIQSRRRWRTERTLEHLIDMAAKGFCSQLPGKDKVEPWKPRSIDDLGPGYHACSLSGAAGFTPALQADDNVLRAVDFNPKICRRRSLIRTQGWIA